MAWYVVLITLLLFPGGAAAKQQAVPQLFVTSDRCLACHNDLVTPEGQDVSIGFNWQSSMMAHSAKDPYWQASVRRESLEHPSVSQAIEDECAACHMPMARYQAKAQGGKGRVFAHMPLLPAQTTAQRLAGDGVSCSMCHQIGPDKLGTEASFTAGFVVDTKKNLGQRTAFGPFEVDAGRSQVMQSAARLRPTQGMHIQDSALCGSCHTLYTHARGPDGEVVGELPEQVPYLEWKHSAYQGRQSCQSCHMPQLQEPMQITSVLGQPREGFSRHVFRGGNFLMPQVFNRNKAALGVTTLSQDLAKASWETKQHLKESAARVAIQDIRTMQDRLELSVSIMNLAGHKLPTAYPSRRAWIHLQVRDSDGNVVFDSGALNADGSIQGNDNDLDRNEHEPHYEDIQEPGQVQIYEPIMVDSQDRVTTGLLSAVRYKKDNRLLPHGFDKKTAGEDIAVQGKAQHDSDFKGGRDTVRYSVALGQAQGPFSVKAELWYQPIGFRWAKNLKQQQAAEIDRFVSYFDAMSEQSGIVMASDSKTVP